MAILQVISDAISRGVNRDVTQNFTNSVIGLYRRSATKDDFTALTKTLGFSDKLAHELFVLINDNIERISKELPTEPAKTSEPEPKKKKKTTEKKRSGNHTLDFSYEDEDIDNPIDDLDGLSQTKTEEPKDTVPKKPKFKKLKKERVNELKSEPQIKSDLDESGPVKQEDQQKVEKAPNPKITLSQLAEMETLEQKKVEDEASLDIDNVVEEDIDNDREWYTQEDIGHVAYVDDYGDVDNLSVQHQNSKSRKKKHVNRQERSGGGFDASTGEYIDYDHEESASNRLSRIPIISHFLVPPFLRGSEDFLTPSLDRTTSRSIGPSVDPVKDPESELALASRNGSFIVRDRKEKKERVQQTRDRVAGEEKQAPQSEEKKEEVEEQKDDENAYLQRKSLPAYKARDELVKLINENQIVVVVGETGSGKTTQIAQFLNEEGYGKSVEKNGTRSLIGCTQPRRVAAMSVAKRVSEEMRCKLGEEVGYAIRFEDKTSHTKTVIKYMTEGILLRELLVDPNLESYSCVIMDEAHERTLSTDILLGLFRQLLRRRKDLKLIVTSATMNAEMFTKFFGSAPQYFIPGRTFPVEVFFSRSSCPDYVDTAVKQVMTIHLANQGTEGDILVFMTGQEDIETTCEMIHEKLNMLENPPPLDVYPIYSTLPSDVQRRIFNKSSLQRRKVVVATNIAETSLTVDGIKYVVDCGLVKLKQFNPKLGMDTLQVVPISLANAQQRSGRAGRTGPGIAYRLYTEAAASPDQMYEQPIPEIKRTNLTSVMLLLKSLKVVDVLKFPFLDPPPSDLLACSLYDLWVLGAIDNLGNLTDLGLKLTDFPMEPTLAKLILLSSQKQFSCSHEILTIVSMLSVPNVFHRPKERADDADAAHERFMISGSDHLTLLNVYTQWEQRSKQPKMTAQKLSAWSGRNFLNHRSLLRAREIRRQLSLIMVKKNYPVVKASSDTDIRRCLCASYFQQSATLSKMSSGGGQAEYTNLRHAYMKMYVHPTSALVGGTDLSPSFVVYDELVLTKKEYMQCVTAVEPEWLLEYGHVFYGISATMRKQLEGQLDFEIVDKSDWEKRLDEDSKKLTTPQRDKVATKKARTIHVPRKGF